MKPRTYREYIQGTISFGVAYGVVTLLARWVTGNTILSSPETLVKYGLLGGIGYAMMGAIALFLFGWITPYIRERFPDSMTIGDVLKARLRGRSYWFVMWILLLTSLDSLLIQALGAGVLFHFLLKTPIYVGLLFFFLYCFLLSLGGMKQIQRFEGIHISFIFAAVILIPVYFFIQKGIFPVYDGLLLYHPYLLFLKHNEITLFILTALLIGFGQVLIDRASWQRIYIIEKSKVRTSFMMAGLIWATIPLAFTAIVLIAVYGQGFENIYSILSQLVEKIDSLFLLLLFIGCCFSAIASTVGAELHATSIMFIRNMMNHRFDWSEDLQIKKTCLVSGVLSLLLFLISSILSPSLMELIFFFAQVYAAIIPTMLVVIFYKESVPLLVPYCSLIGLGIGLISLLNYNSIQSTWISFFVSSGLVVILLAINEVLIHRK